MTKTTTRFDQVPVGSLFLTRSATLPEDELYEKSSPHGAHQLSLPEFNRVGATWKFQNQHIVTMLRSEFSAVRSIR